ncbi:late control protein D [Lysinibacillus alkalisoli]|uniref:Late control protein D n=1 Tax=Lysinibacillus alkalisoli TaxID=1911548 RepID=A0A917LJ91_9BACI|nr:contractile injection system protein, VgrG/Pvc8 family [Lysinibacillus alkalisoli]GGG32981.1 late control protein D [Lysinibacillus alkalisoli]
MEARRTKVNIIYQGKDITTELEEYLTNFSFEDAEGTADTIQIDLQDRHGKWHGPWLPRKNDKIKAMVEILNNTDANSKEKLDCGIFYVDDSSYSGPPDKVSIKAIAIPLPEGGKDEKNSRVWENVMLSQVAGDIAKSAGLKLIFDATDHLYDRVVQDQETDLSFIKKRALKEGVAIKVTGEYLVLYEQKKYENKSPILTITKGADEIKDYSFKEDSNEKGYKKIEITYFDSNKKKNLKYTYDVPGVAEGPTFKSNERAKNLAEAKRFATNIAREKNKREKTGSITLKGNPKMLTGYTVQIKGFAKFDGKYFIEKTNHDITGGYTTKISLREVLKY